MWCSLTCHLTNSLGDNNHINNNINFNNDDDNHYYQFHQELATILILYSKPLFRFYSAQRQKVLDFLQITTTWSMQLSTHKGHIKRSLRTHRTHTSLAECTHAHRCAIVVTNIGGNCMWWFSVHSYAMWPIDLVHNLNPVLICIIQIVYQVSYTAK